MFFLTCLSHLHCQEEFLRIRAATHTNTNVPLTWNLSVLYSTRIYFIPASTEALTVAQKFPDCKKSEYVSTGTKDHETLPLTNVQGMTVMTLAQDILLVTIHYQGLVGQFAPSMWCKRPQLWQAANKKGMSIMTKVPHILLAAFFNRGSPRLSRPGCTQIDSEYVVQETTIMTSC